MINNSFKDFKYQNKIMVFKDTPTFGRGAARIMTLVKETGKLSEAYKIMGLSSSKGWKIIKKVEKDLGFEVFVTVVGGKDGGHSSLSIEGQEFLDRYNAFVKELNLESDKIFKKYFPD